MLNKDQYNEEEYNDYYRQEVEGAELSDFEEEEGNGLLSKLILLLVLIALSIAGYFGYKAISKSDTENEIDASLQVSIEPSLPKSEQELNNTLKEENKVKHNSAKVSIQKNESSKTVNSNSNLENSITSEVTKAVKSEGKMSAEEVTSVVAAVMQKINQQQKSSTSTPSVSTKKEDKLVTELSDSEVDSVSADLIKELENVNVNKDTEVESNNKHIDTYNKVNVQNNAEDNSLNDLSRQISNLIDEEPKENKTSEEQTNSYASSLKSEITVHKNEMRIIVVKEGDTLGKLAERAYGSATEYQKIYTANPELTRPDHIYIGQKLRIPN